MLAKVGDQFVPIPINIDTVNRLYGLDLDEDTIHAFFDNVREPRERIVTSEDVVLNAVGRTCTKNSSAAIHASNGDSTRPNSPLRWRRASRRAPTATTATSPTVPKHAR